MNNKVDIELLAKEVLNNPYILMRHFNDFSTELQAQILDYVIDNMNSGIINTINYLDEVPKKLLLAIFKYQAKEDEKIDFYNYKIGLYHCKEKFTDEEADIIWNKIKDKDCYEYSHVINDLYEKVSKNKQKEISDYIYTNKIKKISDLEKYNFNELYDKFTENEVIELFEKNKLHTRSSYAMDMVNDIVSKLNLSSQFLDKLYNQYKNYRPYVRIILAHPNLDTKYFENPSSDKNYIKGLLPNPNCPDVLLVKYCTSDDYDLRYIAEKRLKQKEGKDNDK